MNWEVDEDIGYGHCQVQLRRVSIWIPQWLRLKIFRHQD